MVIRIAFYISGHGFGHASRSIELIKAIVAARPDARVVVKTAAPRWLFDAAGPLPIEVTPLETDPGIAQIDSLHLDERESVRRAAAFYGDFDSLVNREAAFLRSAGATIVLGDVPPLAYAAAAKAGVPSVAIGNFTWDWIYAAYDSFERDAPGVIGMIREAYALATRALRLPLHGGFEPMAGVTVDIPFVARRSTRDPADTRRELGIRDDRPFVLASFGGYGLSAAYDEIARSQRLTVLSPGRDLPAGVTYQDVVAAADVVISKPGYGIVSECLANGRPLLFTSRGRFAEYDVFVAEMPRVLRCRFIPQDDLLAGRWLSHINALVQQPPAPEIVRFDGADVAAKAILSFLA